MARYDTTRRTKYTSSDKERVDNKDKYDTTIYLKVPERNDDLHVIAQEGDRLDNLAFEFYGDPKLCWFNPGPGLGLHYILNILITCTPPYKNSVISRHEGTSYIRRWI